ncbi:uncharacterized protein FOMMEDRAFT_151052 [Fomitiporia mediterranea MF3/22]|uniref:uncharacterized protein n=1 Tax=Fomitiporia mediterranea (strain MF3/22) TaxID=694068 RepID=UPI0004408F37|nr:uncharacterized protein FOMMEDRAFT_151052 [Fomitiporia mediterranea MF3/22]EJD08291.1 hypothetical protein FOMMEDRAFT_151052 [Fomitiporia mediterranea MF3/22]
MPNDFFKNFMHSRTSSRSTAQATIDEHTLATMFMYDHSYCTTLSLTLDVFYFSIHSMFDITLDRPTLLWPATYPTRDELNPSTPSTSPSPFEPERPRIRVCNAHVQTLLRLMLKSARSMLQVSTLAHTRCTLSRCIHLLGPITHSRQQYQSPRTHSQLVNLTIYLISATSASTTRPTSQPARTVIQLAGTERRPKRSDEDYIKRPKNALFCLATTIVYENEVEYNVWTVVNT